MAGLAAAEEPEEVATAAGEPEVASVGLLDTLTSASALDPVSIDEHVAAAWALLRQRRKAAGAKMEVNDSWIAATALACQWPVVTQEDGFPTNIPDLTIIKV